MIYHFVELMDSLETTDSLTRLKLGRVIEKVSSRNVLRISPIHVSIQVGYRSSRKSLDPAASERFRNRN